MRKGSEKASLKVNNLDIVASDSRQHPEQPQKYGVNVYQGAFTIYNFNKNKDSNIDLTADNIRTGRKLSPVFGSGIFICGAGDDGGWMTVQRLHTKEVYSNSTLPENTSTLITAGIFIVNGVKAKEVVHEGNIATYGTNDMV